MESAETPAEAFRRAVKAVGGQTATGLLLSIGQPAISKRLKAKKPAEPEEVLLLEQASGVSRYLLRPDIYRRIEASTRSLPDRFEHAQ